MLLWWFQDFVVANVGQRVTCSQCFTVRFVFMKHESKLKGKPVFTLLLLFLLFFLLFIWKNKGVLEKMAYESFFAYKA